MGDEGGEVIQRLGFNQAAVKLLLDLNLLLQFLEREFG